MYEKAKQQNVEYELEQSDITWVPILKGKEKDVEVKVNYNFQMQTPVEKGSVIGEISVVLEEEVLLSRKIVLKEEVEKKQVSDYMMQLISNMARYISSIKL